MWKPGMVVQLRSAQNRYRMSARYFAFDANVYRRKIRPAIQFSSQTQYSPKNTKEDARFLLNERKNPLGSFTASQYDKAKLTLEDLMEQNGKIDAESVNLSLALLKRLVRETVVHGNKEQAKWLCQLSLISQLLSNWDRAMRRRKKVVSAKDLFLQLEAMSSLLPSFRLDNATFEMIMNSAVRRESPRNAPIVAEEWLGRIRMAGFAPNYLLFNRVLYAWSKSQLPRAAEKVEAIYRSMLKENKPSNIATYNTLKNFWGGEAACNRKITEILDDLNNEMLPNVACLNERLHCFVRQGMPGEADKMLQKLGQHINVENHEERKLIGFGAQKILAAYRTLITKPTISREEKELYVEKAEDFFYRMELVHTIADGGLSGECLPATGFLLHLPCSHYFLIPPKIS
jgi:hypothetical protein